MVGDTFENSVPRREFSSAEIQLRHGRLVGTFGLGRRSAHCGIRRLWLVAVPRAGRTLAASASRSSVTRSCRRRSRTRAGSVADARTTLSTRIDPSWTRVSILSMASSAGTSTMVSQSRRTSNRATSTGVSRSLRRFVLAARLTNLTRLPLVGGRPGTATVSWRGTWVDRPNESAALRPAGPVPGRSTIVSTKRSDGGGSHAQTSRGAAPIESAADSPQLLGSVESRQFFGDGLWRAVEVLGLPEAIP